MKAICKFCGSKDMVGSEVCDHCWHEMRFNPEGFESRMNLLGIKIERQKSHFKTKITWEGKTREGIASRDPYKLVPIENIERGKK